MDAVGQAGRERGRVPGQGLARQHRRRLRNNNYEKDGETVYGMAFTAEEIDYLDSRAESEARRSRGDDSAPRPATAALCRPQRPPPAASPAARQPAHADA